MKKWLNQFRKRNIPILTFFHDEYSHFGRSANLNLLFDICYGNSDILIHLGEKSYEKYSQIYTDAQHLIIHHPLYTGFDTKINSQSARQKLGVSDNDFLVIVPGAIRSSAEMKYAKELFSQINYSRKKLVFLRTWYLKKPKHLRNLNEFKSWVYYFIHHSIDTFFKRIKYLHGYMNPEQLSRYFAAADLVIIPRTEILNSGNIILAAQFGKPMIGTGAGNMGELLEFLNQKICLPGEKVAANKIKTLIESSKDKSVELIERIQLYSGDELVKKQWQKALNL